MLNHLVESFVFFVILNREFAEIVEKSLAFVRIAKHTHILHISLQDSIFNIQT